MSKILKESAIDSLAQVIKDASDDKREEEVFIAQPSLFNRTFNWQQEALQILQSNPSKRFTSAEIYSLINTTPTNSIERRKHMINLSISLSKLEEKGLIKIDKESAGRGFVYYTEQKTGTFG